MVCTIYIGGVLDSMFGMTHSSVRNMNSNMHSVYNDLTQDVKALNV